MHRWGKMDAPQTAEAVAQCVVAISAAIVAVASAWTAARRR